MKLRIVHVNRVLNQINWRRFWPCIVFSGLLLLHPAPSWGQSDNFNDGDDAGWTRYDPIGQIPGVPSGVGTWTFPENNSYRIQTAVWPPSLGGPGRAGSLRTDVTYTDFYVSVDIVDWDPTLEQAIGLVGRMHNLGPGMSDGYALTYQVTSGDIDITRFANEDPSGGELTLDGSDVVDMVPGSSYRYIFIGEGSKLTARVYRLPITNQFSWIVNATATDSAYSSGYCGLINFDNSGGTGRTDVTYDNYMALVREPPWLSYGLITGFKELWVQWPTNNPGFILQGSPSLDQPDWRDITGPIYIPEGQNYYRYDQPWIPEEPAPTPPVRFFRLIKP